MLLGGGLLAGAEHGVGHLVGFISDAIAPFFVWETFFFENAKTVSCDCWKRLRRKVISQRQAASGLRQVARLERLGENVFCGHGGR